MSLRPNDLEGLVLTQISIDEYKSKLGEDRSVVVVAVAVTEESAAHDLGDFVERGPFKVWDVDVSPAPDKNGNYFVFIEIERSHLMWNTIIAIFEHTERITGKIFESITFTCPAQDRALALTEENFKSSILQSPYRWDIAHDVYPEVPATTAVDSAPEQEIQKRMKFLTDY
jgi:hypothetical protein